MARNGVPSDPGPYAVTARGSATVADLEALIHQVATLATQSDGVSAVETPDDDPAAVVRAALDLARFRAKGFDVESTSSAELESGSDNDDGPPRVAIKLTVAQCSVVSVPRARSLDRRRRPPLAHGRAGPSRCQSARDPRRRGCRPDLTGRPS